VAKIRSARPRRALGAILGGLLLLPVSCAAGRSKASGDAPAPLAGYRWAVTQIRHGDFQFALDRVAWLAFHRDGRLEENDTSGPYSLRYRTTGRGFHPSGYPGSFAWMAAGVQMSVVDALGALLTSPEVVAVGDEHEVTLSAKGYVFHLHRLGPVT